MEGKTLVLSLIVIFLVIMILSAIKVVPEYKRLVRFRLGRNRGEQANLGPGLVLIWPIIDRITGWHICTNQCLDTVRTWNC